MADLDVLEARGLSVPAALDVMRGREGWYDPTILEALAQVRQTGERRVRLREIFLDGVEQGMIFLEDVKSRSGVLLIARGQVVTDSLAERIRNLSSYIQLSGPVRVAVPDQPRQADPAIGAA